MRISDLSTFDSKPILLSQFAELLNSNNITMQGNQVNVPSGLVLLDDKGKIPEDADIQRIFYIDGEFPTENLVKNALYVSSSGEARATGENAEYINISLQVVSDFSTVSDETVATTKAIKDYVDAAVTGVATGTSGVLSSYATKEYVDSAVASASGEQHIFYVDSLPAVADAVENSLYVIKSTKEAQIFDGTEYAPISLETLNDFSTVSNDTLATTQAISAFVDEKISNINIPDPDLSAYQPVSSMTDYAKKTDIPNISGKVDNVGTNQSINDNATFTINATTSFDVNAPFSSFAGGKVVCYDGLGVTGDITLNGNTFNISGGLVVVGEDGKIPSSLYNAGGLTSISVGSGLSGNGTSSSPLVVDLSNYQSTAISLTTPEFIIGGSSIRIGTGTGNIYLNYDNSAPDSNIYVNNHALNTAGGLVLLGSDGKIPSSLYDAGSQSIFQVDSFPSSGTNNSLYVDKATSEVKGYFDGAWQNISFECVDVISGSASTETVPSTKAVKDYVDALHHGPEMKTIAITKDIVFKKDIAVYKIEVAAATTFTFDFSHLDENNCYTFELWVSMSTPVTLTFPSDVAWLNDEVPDMSEASTYCIVVRKLPAAMATSTITSPKALLNLAYQYPLVLG